MDYNHLQKIKPNSTLQHGGVEKNGLLLFQTERTDLVILSLLLIHFISEN